MSGCCRPDAYGDFFDEKQARKDLRRYRRKGLAQDARRGVEFLRGRARSILEVGGGIGAAHVELLNAGAERAVNVELSPGYEAVALELANDARVGDRIERRVGDFVAQADALPPADAVVMYRVVCCYPDYEALLGAAAAKAERFLVLSFPRGGPVTRIVVAAGNAFLRLARKDFRSYAHDPRALVRTLEARGFRLAEAGGGIVWRTAAFERA